MELKSINKKILSGDLGFELYIQKSFSDDEKLFCIQWLNSFIVRTIQNPDFKYFGGGSGGGRNSGINRGCYGITINRDKNIVFRRISKNKRKFACVYGSELEVYNDKYLFKQHSGYRDLYSDGEEIPDICICPRHKGSIRVKWKNYIPKLLFYAKIGNI